MITLYSKLHRRPLTKVFTFSEASSCFNGITGKFLNESTVFLGILAIFNSSSHSGQFYAGNHAMDVLLLVR